MFFEEYIITYFARFDVCSKEIGEALLWGRYARQWCARL